MSDKKSVSNEDILQVLSDFRRDVLVQFDKIDKRFEEVDNRIKQVEKRFDGVETQFEEALKHLDSHHETINLLSSRSIKQEVDIEKLKKNVIELA